MKGRRFYLVVCGDRVLLETSEVNEAWGFRQGFGEEARLLVFRECHVRCHAEADRSTIRRRVPAKITRRNKAG